MKKLSMFVLLLTACFASYGQFRMGSTTSIGAGEFNMTPSTDTLLCQFQVGSLWSPVTVDWTQHFTVNFDARFDAFHLGGADGICAVFKRGPATTTIDPVAWGGNIGYYGTLLDYTNTSLAVEFDIYDNGSTWSDITNDHVAITTNAVIAPIPGGGPVPILPFGTVRDNNYRNYTIDWCPSTNTISVFEGNNLRLATLFNPLTLWTAVQMTSITCGFTSATGGSCSNQLIRNIRVASPVIPLVLPATSICVGSSSTLSAGMPGTWSSTSPIVNIVSNVATGLAVGTATITFDQGCGDFSTTVLSVTPLPAPISGPTVICAGIPTLYTTASTGGIWTSSNPAIATVYPGGVVIGLSGGTATIDYSFGTSGGSAGSSTGTGCFTSMVVTVIPRATACVTSGWDVGCGCYAFIITGTPGAIVNYQLFDCAMSPTTTGSIVLTGGTAIIPWTSLPFNTCKLCITTIQHMGCSWHCNCGAGCCAFLNGARPAAPGTTAPSAAAQTMLSVMPNPNQGIVTLTGGFEHLTNATEGKLEIVNLLGMTIYRDVLTIEDGKINKVIKIDNKIPNGTYLIKVNAAGETQTVRFSLDR